MIVLAEGCSEVCNGFAESGSLWPGNLRDYAQSAFADTAPEVSFRKALWAHGVRYKVCPADVAGKPDVVIPARRLAIFIDGDFWHGGQWRRRGLATLEDQFRETATKSYWLRKIRRNVQRDCRTTVTLQHEGWTVLRIWESQIKNDLEACVQMTMQILASDLKPTPLSLIPQMTFLEFFAGIGLMRMGLEQGGWSIRFANDIDEQKHAMYTSHFKDAAEHFVLGDVHTIPVDQIPTATLATASFPCNDLSLAGSRHGLVGKQSSAFWGFVRVLEEMGDADRRWSCSKMSPVFSHRMVDMISSRRF